MKTFVLYRGSSLLAIFSNSILRELITLDNMQNYLKGDNVNLEIGRI